jgi:hopanoid C-3 methylase HpnR
MYDVDVAVEELSRVREPGVFIVDDVAFIQKKHGLAIGEGIARRGIKKEYYLETRADVLLKNKEVFEFWRDLGLKYMFLGLEAIDEEGLEKYRKRVSLGQNFEALEYARKLGIVVAVNLIADPAWDRDRFRVIREWCLDIPEIVSISVNTPYPGTENWQSESRGLITRDYRLFDIQHTVLPTRLPLPEFYKELVTTQQVLNKKHLGLNSMFRASSRVLNRLLHGQTNFLRMLFKFSKVYDPDLLLADHERAVRYELASPPAPNDRIDAKQLYVHPARGRKSRQIDDTTERFVDTTRTGTTN